MSIHDEISFSISPYVSRVNKAIQFYQANLDKTLNQDDNYSENISIRCDCCKFLNSFSFVHKSTNCIKCNSPLSPSQIELAISYRMKSQFHSNQNSSQVNSNPWSDVNVTS